MWKVTLIIDLKLLIFILKQLRLLISEHLLLISMTNAI